MAAIKRGCGGVNLLMQNVYASRYSPYDYFESDRMLFRLRGLTSLPEISFQDDLRLCEHICKTEGGFLYSFGYYPDVRGFSEDSAHSMAFYRTSVGNDGFIYVYDPNFGEFHVIPDKFKDFLLRFLVERYGPTHARLLRSVIISDKDHLSGG